MGGSSNTNALLAYILGPITGIIFVLIEKNDKFVRFHAFQSIFASVVLIALNLVLSSIGLYLISSVLGLVALVLFIFLMMKAYQGQKYKLPVIGDFAEKTA